ncbi:MAG: hypothetical protein ACO3PV_10525, partial [Pseudohongiellaceae bacterium]
FNSLLPLPTVLRNVSSPVRIQPQEEINATWDEWYKRKDEGKLEKWELEQGRPMGLGITQDTYNTLMKEYGVSNWYDWSVMNWGTKWDCYDVREWSIAVADEEMTATIYYETAWSPATQLWLTVSKQYPTLTFFHEFADEGGGFLGDDDVGFGWRLWRLGRILAVLALGILGFRVLALGVFLVVFLVSHDGFSSRWLTPPGSCP